MTVTDLHDSGLASISGQLMPDYPLPLVAHADLVMYLYPGASGIIRGDDTPMVDAAQHRGFRGQAEAFKERGFTVVGLSSRSIHCQRDIAYRNKVSHALVSDPHFYLADALGLRTLRFGDKRVYERMTLVIIAGWTRLALLPLPTPESHPVYMAELLRRHLEDNQPAGT